MLPIEFFRKGNPETQWMIEGKHDPKQSITYGVVPDGMRELVAAKPLLEGERYYVYVESLVGRSFIIQNGEAKETS